MAVLTLREHDDPSAFIADFTGTDAAVTDYLLTEVLDRLSPSERRFLLRISVVDAICGELADALTNDTDGDRHLQRLASSNAMLEPLDWSTGWFRFHPLLRDLLRAELHAGYAAELPQLHHDAARLARRGRTRARRDAARAGERRPVSWRATSSRTAGSSSSSRAISLPCARWSRSCPPTPWPQSPSSRWRCRRATSRTGEARRADPDRAAPSAAPTGCRPSAGATSTWRAPSSRSSRPPSRRAWRAGSHRTPADWRRGSRGRGDGPAALALVTLGIAELWTGDRTRAAARARGRRAARGACAATSTSTRSRSPTWRGRGLSGRYPRGARAARRSHRRAQRLDAHVRRRCRARRARRRRVPVGRARGGGPDARAASLARREPRSVHCAPAWRQAHARPPPAARPRRRSRAAPRVLRAGRLRASEPPAILVRASGCCSRRWASGRGARAARGGLSRRAAPSTITVALARLRVADGRPSRRPRWSACHRGRGSVTSACRRRASRRSRTTRCSTTTAAAALGTRSTSPSRAACAAPSSSSARRCVRSSDASCATRAPTARWPGSC